ncbi:hypothetical protein, partial [Ornithobacterium rhinotracheale]
EFSISEGLEVKKLELKKLKILESICVSKKFCKPWFAEFFYAQKLNPFKKNVTLCYDNTRSSTANYR